MSNVVVLSQERDESLSAPTLSFEVRQQSIVILVFAVMSLIGAAWIIASYAVFPNMRSFRHRLILGLATSDLVMAFNFLCSTSMNIGGRFIGAPQNAGFCNYNGFMTQVFVIQTDYWVLTIAICTYFILAGHKKPSSWIQNREWVVLTIPWFFSTLWASIGLGVVGYDDVGAWCWFVSERTRLLVNFIPRWVIIGTMTALYAYLYVVLYRAHSQLVSAERASFHRRSGYAASVEDRRGNPRQGASGRSSTSLRKIKRIARLMLLYPLAYATIWSIPTAIRIYQVTTGKRAPFPLQTLEKACIVIQGFVDAVIYGVNETSRASWRAHLSRQGYPTIESVNASSEYGPSEMERSRRLSVNGTREAVAVADAAASEGVEELGHPDAVELRDRRTQAAPTGARRSIGGGMSTLETGSSAATTMQSTPY